MSRKEISQHTKRYYNGPRLNSPLKCSREALQHVRAIYIVSDPNSVTPIATNLEIQQGYDNTPNVNQLYLAPLA